MELKRATNKVIDPAVYKPIILDDPEVHHPPHTSPDTNDNEINQFL